ncbi:hypothetical protein EOD41_15000 [Mucilaginibacter limnophilus]|uniref:Soluble ligand binding domain-containing protein n=1 Tax=Mucilaginibacter limnophilus TaxID=1932778 RepID=A0A437MQ37_9SPHI|nr:polysaccharide biosynthesis/export family protein [Mucilaginibacter limnophilus]RVT99750.1 hypothetical protein EOD41_15000 [Mucilaginibacter limnophilus]
MKIFKFGSAFLVNAVLLFLLLTSCSTPKNIPYFENIPDSGSIVDIETTPFKEPLIAPDDILSITIQTIDPEVTGIVNQAPSFTTSGGTGMGVASSQQTTPGYLVGKDGSINFPMVGKVTVAGYTTHQAADIIAERASQYLKMPTVQVRFANFKITVLGEVNRPASFTVANEKVSVIDAIGLAGDLTIYGKRENVLVIRENNGKKEATRLNLTSASIFKSSHYYLKQNDIVYIEPNKAKIASNNAPRTQAITISLSALSLLVLLVTRL